MKKSNQTKIPPANGNQQKANKKRSHKGKKHAHKRGKKIQLSTSLPIIATLFVLAEVVIAIIMHDFITPAFISNTLYTSVVYIIAPIFSTIAIIAFIIYRVQRYRTDIEYQDRVKCQFELHTNKGYCKLVFTILSSPFLIYLCVWPVLVPNIELYAYYFYQDPWTDVYQLTSVGSCGSDYGQDCVRLNIQDLNSNKETYFFWFEDSYIIKQLSGNKIRLMGHQGVFGSDVNGVQW
jgi:amino acid transporter